MSDLRDFRNHSVYLMPFGVVSLTFLEALKDEGINVAGIYDNNVDIQGKIYFNTPIQAPSAQDNAEIVVICNYIYERAMMTQLKSLGINNIMLMSDVLDTDDEQSLLDCAARIDYNAIRSIMPRYAGYAKTIKNEIQKNLLPKFIKSSDALVLPHSNLNITERCTLRCEHCSSWMQFFTHPQHYDLRDIQHGIDALFRIVDYTRDIHIIGGEPFMHPQIGEIIDYVAGIDKIGVINIITNGTIIPDDTVCEIMASKRNVSVRISDYGALSRKLKPLTTKLEQYNILYAVMENMVWYDYAHYREQPLPLKDVQEQYDTCPLNCMAIATTRFSRCQIAMSAAILGATPSDENINTPLDVIDLTQIDRESFTKYLQEKTPLQACRICTGKSRETRRIPAATQVAKPLPYTVLTPR